MTKKSLQQCFHTLPHLKCNRLSLNALYDLFKSTNILYYIFKVVYCELHYNNTGSKFYSFTLTLNDSYMHLDIYNKLDTQTFCSTVNSVHAVKTLLNFVTLLHSWWYIQREIMFLYINDKIMQEKKYLLTRNVSIIPV